MRKKKKFSLKSILKDALDIGLMAITLNGVRVNCEVNFTSQVYRGNTSQKEYAEEKSERAYQFQSLYDYFLAAEYTTGKNSKENWVCKHWAGSVYEDMLNMLKNDNKTGLLNKVRLAYTSNMNNTGIGHAWIEIKNGEKWDPLETVPCNRLFAKELKYITEFVSIPGKRITYPISLNSFLKTAIPTSKNNRNRN